MAAPQAKESAEKLATPSIKRPPITLEGIRGALGTRKFLLEVFKFGCYVSIPVVLIFAFAADSNNLAKVIHNRQYVVYPPEGPRPPPPEVIRAIARKRKEAEAAAAAAAAAGSSS